jgi:MerR family transcriptional regulator/heat shock protein HspR
MTERWTTRITVIVAARRTGLSTSTVRRYIQRGLVGEALTEADMARLRRIRRLADLGVNLAGVEIILCMRRRIEELQSEAKELKRHLASYEGQGGLKGKTGNDAKTGFSAPCSPRP